MCKPVMRSSEPGVIQFRRLMLAAMQPGPAPVKLLVLEATGVIDIDFTAAQVFKDVEMRASRRLDGFDFISGARQVRGKSGGLPAKPVGLGATGSKQVTGWSPHCPQARA